jgi:diguanylate cyclase (GGDEF)-like protein
MLNRLPIAVKVFVAPALIILLMIGLVLTAIIALQQQQSAFFSVVSGSFKTTTMATRLLLATAEVQSDVLRYTQLQQRLPGDDRLLADLRQSIKTRYAGIDTLFGELKRTTSRSGETDAVSNISDFLTIHRAVVLRILDGTSSGTTTLSTLMAHYQQLQSYIVELGTRSDESAAAAEREAAAYASRLSRALLVGSLAVVIVSVLITVYVGRTISRPFTRMIGTLSAIADGRFDAPIPGLERRDEMGAMARAVDVFASVSRERAATNAQLERGLSEVEQTHREIALLSELSGFLQACANEQEAAAGIGESSTRLLPGSIGALYLIDEAGDMLVEAVGWGERPMGDTRTFGADDCWALRRAHAYRLDRPTPARCCAHLVVQGRERGPYACLPLMAQGRIFGLLSIEHRLEPEERQLESRQRLAVALAEQVGLALANIRLRETLRQQSIRDPLTGLFNRRFMNETLGREIARAERKGHGVAVALVDIDHFKRINDTFGHDAGDAVLVAVARAMEQRVRQSDVVCRLGGEEFVVLLPGIDADQAELRAADLLQSIRDLRLEHGKRPLGRVTASLGLAFHPVHGRTGEALIESADAALYEAKAGGRDRVVIAGVQPPASGFGTG